MGHPLVALAGGRGIGRPACTARSSHRPAADSPTVEGIFAALEPAERTLLAERLAGDVPAGRRAAVKRPRCRVAVFLVDMAGQCLGTAGDLTPWQ